MDTSPNRPFAPCLSSIRLLFCHKNQSVSASAGAAVETVDKAAGDAKAAVAESVSSEGSSGTVKLDRPKEVSSAGLP